MIFPLSARFFSFVIFFVAVDLKTPVNLFQQYNSHKLVRKRHVGKTKVHIRAGDYILMKSQRSPYYKGYVAYSINAGLINPLCHLLGGKP